MIPYRLERVLSLRGMREGVRRDCDCLRETLNEAICVGFDVFLEFLEVGHGGRWSSGDLNLELSPTEVVRLRS